MQVALRKAEDFDLPFLREMLYEAVFWRRSKDTPSFEEGMAYPEVKSVLEGCGERDGDTAVIAQVGTKAVGAAWFRFWSDSSFRGYMDDAVPVVVIGVAADFRRKGTGKMMLKELINNAEQQSIEKISLAVSKDNYALNLYRQLGFIEHEDKGDWFIMTCETKKA